MMPIRLFLILAILLSACSTGSSSPFRGQAQIEKTNFTWNRIVKTSDPRSQTPLFFAFTPAGAGGPNANGVTEADWERQAAKWGMSVFGAKKVLGESAYKTASGDLATCTYNAIQRGLCGSKLGLSVAQRAELAKRALATSQTCRWIGFDPTYNSVMSRRAGAENRTLWVKADCS